MSLPKVPVDNAAQPTINPPPLQESHNLFFQYNEEDNNDVEIVGVWMMQKGWRLPAFKQGIAVARAALICLFVFNNSLSFI